ncbi:hypothetical protein FSP39_010320 [Pinctada imbricata]|uniref:Uncharacterized protein n=1 Tax=Pinctada imbricata TaxID=66713 RepID=A0AA88XR74_PINIB|nr:hypothetical protein FSP39_010320 [Pinctada imbricata]
MSMGRTYDFEDKRLLSLMEMIDRIFSDPAIRGPASFLTFAKYIPGDPLHFKLRQEIVGKIIAFLGETVEEHKKSLDEDNVRDYIDAFLLAKKKDGKDSESNYSDEQLLQTLRDFFVAGHETTVTALRWAFLLLIHNPGVQNKMRKEIESVTGSSRMPSWGQKSELPYCEAAISECLRNKNIAPTTLPHGVDFDVSWNQYRIPKGATVIGNLHSVSYDPKLFPEPDKFDPERFLDKSGKLNDTHLIIPFGIGRRVCLGEALARMEVFLFLTTVIQRYQLLPEDTNNLPSLEGKLGTTYSPFPYKLRAVPWE